MYVAITRARKRLYLSHAQSRMLHGRTTFNLPSRFIDELPEGALKWLSAKGGFGSFAPKSEAASAWGRALEVNLAHIRPKGQKSSRALKCRCKGCACAWHHQRQDGVSHQVW